MKMRTALSNYLPDQPEQFGWVWKKKMKLLGGRAPLSNLVSLSGFPRRRPNAGLTDPVREGEWHGGRGGLRAHIYDIFTPPNEWMHITQIYDDILFLLKAQRRRQIILWCGCVLVLIIWGVRTEENWVDGWVCCRLSCCQAVFLGRDIGPWSGF